MGRQIAQSIAMLFLLAISGFSGSLSAQKSSIKAVIVQATEGEVFLDGNPLQLVKGSIRFFQTGQTLSTRHGRIELIFASNANLSVGENASFRMEQRNPNGAGLTIEKGSILIEVVRKLADPVRVRVSDSTVEISEPGLYRLDSNTCDLRVYDGTALADSGSKQAQIESNRKIRLVGDLSQSKFDPKESDALDQWSAHRSFDIYLADPETNNWKWKGLMPSAQNPNPVGFFENSKYRVRFKAQMPPQYARRFRAMQGMDWDQTRRDAEDRLKKEADLQREQQNEDMWKKSGKIFPHP